MSLQQDVIIRYRDEEHVRFELPASLCAGEKAERLVAGLRRIEGVYRVDLFSRQRKLAVRFMSTVVDFLALARGLAALLDELASAVETGLSTSKGAVNHPASWVKEKYQEFKETVTAAAILVKAGTRKPQAFLPSSDTTLGFLTDILVLYLIKLHWHAILHEWIRKPWQHKSEWMATVYMIFLMMRSRMPKPQ
ncbi:MAG: cation transporter [Methylococcaceae bacterium]|nr:cation transporter [Methylococcaceae bacterium]